MKRAAHPRIHARPESRHGEIARSADDHAIDAIVLIISLFVLFSIVYPLVYILSSSLSEPKLVAAGAIVLLPREFTLEGYQKIFEYKPIWIGYRNTLFYTSLGTLLNLAATVPAAFALSRKDMPGNSFFTGMFAVTMFFSGGIIPTYLVYKQLHLTNTIWAMLIPGMVTMWNTVVCRTYFTGSIPYELQEAARIDGCSDIGIFARIILPLSKPILAVLALFYAVGHWNSYFNALIYLSNIDLFPLQLFLRNILVLGQMNDMMGLDAEAVQQQMRLLELRESMKYGIIIISSLPMLILYPFLQKYFVQGVMVGAIKG